MVLNITDYNDLYVIAVGLCMAYILVKRKESELHNGNNFFAFLQNIGKSAFDSYYKNATSKMIEIDKIQRRAEYFAIEGHHDKKAEGILQVLKASIASISSKIEEINNRVDHLTKQFTRANYFQIIAFDTFIYAFALLFSGVFVSNGVHYFGYYLALLASFVYISSSFYICKDFFCKNVNEDLLRNCLISHSFIIFIILPVLSGVLEYFFPDSSLVSDNIFVCLIALACYYGFIVYTALSVVLCFSVIKFYTLRFPKKEIEHFVNERSKDIEYLTNEYNKREIDVLTADLEIVKT